MKSSEKRHTVIAGTAGGGPPGSGSHRGGGSASGSRRDGNSSSSNSSIIAPPPRAALTSSPGSSPGQAPEPAPGPDGGSSSGAKAEGSSRKDKGSSARAAAAAAAAAAARDPKEKDERIAYLEKEMATMEMEFQRELDKLSQNESETATFWQSKHSALNQQFLRADTELRLLKAEVDVREAEKEELRDGWEGLRRQLKDRDREIEDLRSQVRGMKEWVSTSTRVDGQTSDEVFGDAITRLGNGLQNWIIVNFRRAKMDTSRADDSVRSELDCLVPMYEELAHTAKVHLLQSIVSKVLVDMVFDTYFVGLSAEQTAQCVQMEQLISSFVGPGEAVNQWRSATLTLLRREAVQKMPAETAAAIEDVVGRTNRILGAVTDAKATEARDQGLRALVASSIDLARQLVSQKAVFTVSMPEILPHQRVAFDPATMDDIGGEDEDDLARREICCITFPGVIKRGDESGGHLQFTNVISKARVLCSPE